MLEEVVKRLLDEVAEECRGRMNPLEMARLIEEFREER